MPKILILISLLIIFRCLHSLHEDDIPFNASFVDRKSGNAQTCLYKYR